MKQFRGTRVDETLAEIADPAHTCLVVWDVQNGLVGRVFNKETYLPGLAAFVNEARGRMPVVYTLITPLPRGFQSGWNIYSQMRRMGVSDPEQLPVFMAPGSPEREIPGEVKPASGDIVLEKSTPNIFLGTNFETLLRNRGITTILFTGIATEVGVETSARDAGARGFYPVIVREGVSSMDREAHERSLANLSRQAIVAGMDELKAVWA
jgi:nicotinamidase-related amidase